MSITPAVSPVSTPYRPAALPVPLGPQDGDVFVRGELRVPRPLGLPVTAVRTGVGPWKDLSRDDPAWTEAGVPAGDGSIRLSNGGSRRGGPRGGSIEGLRVNGQSVTYTWYDDNYAWRIDTKAALQSLDAGGHKVALRLPTGRDLDILSEHPLKESDLKNLATALAEVPE
ncbi:MAG TPA: hypothetical protein VGO93_12745, partial [Candidatus Xenobia bacterium]